MIYRLFPRGQMKPAHPTLAEVYMIDLITEIAYRFTPDQVPMLGEKRSTLWGIQTLPSKL
jgi:hypothetical protein